MAFSRGKNLKNAHDLCVCVCKFVLMYMCVHVCIYLRIPEKIRVSRMYVSYFYPS